MHDTDRPHNGQDAPTAPEMVTTPMGYIHPVGFEAVAFMIIGMDRDGTVFINMPIAQPPLCLHLATKGLDYASQKAVLQMQDAQKTRSPIIGVPPGLQVPPWSGPAGRG